MPEFLAYCFDHFYNTTIKEKIEDLQAAVPWTKEYVGELTKTNTSIPFITGIPNNFVGLYIDYSYTFTVNENTDFARIRVNWDKGNLTDSFEETLYINFTSLRNSNYSGKTITSKLFLFVNSPLGYFNTNMPNSCTVMINQHSFNNYEVIGFENNKTSNFTLSGVDEYIESASFKIYKLLGA